MLKKGGYFREGIAAIQLLEEVHMRPKNFVRQRDVARFTGGQMEIRDDSGNFRRGTVAYIAINENVFNENILTVRFAWLGMGIGHPFPKRWVSDSRLEYKTNLASYAVRDVGGGRLSLRSSLIGETVVLFPPDGSGLDPRRVEGLKFKRA